MTPQMLDSTRHADAPDPTLQHRLRPSEAFALIPPVHLSIENSGRLIGTSIEHNRLRLQAILTAGQSSVLFKALDISDGREYAVKCMSRGLKPSKTYARHIRERSLHLRVNGHPNIAALHRAFAQGEHVFFVCKLYTGGDLFGAIESGCFVGKDNFVRHVFLQLCDAVAHCHAHGVYHLDVKPENVLCDRHATRVVLSDFGQATTEQHMSGQCPTGSRFNTPPECYEPSGDDDRITPTAARDVWALGILLVNLITSVNPWHVAEPRDPNFALYLQDPRGYFNPLHLPTDIETLILRALTIDPCERISVDDMRKAVQTIPYSSATNEHAGAECDANSSDRSEMHFSELKA